MTILLYIFQAFFQILIFNSLLSAWDNKRLSPLLVSFVYMVAVVLSFKKMVWWPLLVGLVVAWIIQTIGGLLFMRRLRREIKLQCDDETPSGSVRVNCSRSEEPQESRPLTEKQRSLLAAAGRLLLEDENRKRGSTTSVLNVPSDTRTPGKPPNHERHSETQSSEIQDWPVESKQRRAIRPGREGTAVPLLDGEMSLDWGTYLERMRDRLRWMRLRTGQNANRIYDREWLHRTGRGLNRGNLEDHVDYLDFEEMLLENRVTPSKFPISLSKVQEEREAAVEDVLMSDLECWLMTVLPTPGRE